MIGHQLVLIVWTERDGERRVISMWKANEKERPITNEYETLLMNEKRPELNADWFEQSDAYAGAKLVRRGRPKLDNPKRAISLRIDADVLEHFRSTGAGWQRLMNAELRKAAGL